MLTGQDIFLAGEEQKMAFHKYKILNITIRNLSCKLFVINRISIT